MAIHFDTQGPAPNEFHVPLNTEWQDVKDIWTALGGWSNDWTNFWIALKLPFAGLRMSNSNTGEQSRGGYYWSSSYIDTNNKAYNLYFPSSTIDTQDTTDRTWAFSVRPFKNSPTVPTSSWTKLYWTSIENWGIFWSSTDWLISLSSNWQTWITIQDKNLWATTVWNSWDTLSEANCGKYYQWGNNYWFQRTWTITNTSATQVDASTYWPWNYYSSDTFIRFSGRWDTTDNKNLRWWVSQWMRYDPMRLHWAIQTFHRERPYEWEPWSNTVVYYDIDDNDTITNIYDKSWNNYTQTWNWTAWYTTDVDYWRVATFNWSSYTQASSIVDFWGEYTFISLLKTTSTSSSVQAIVLECASTTVYPIWLCFNYGGAYTLYSSGQWNSNSFLAYWTAWQQIVDEWIMLVWTRDNSGNGKLYLNWNKIAEWTIPAPNYSSWEALQIWRWRNWDANYLNWQFKLFIGENRCWGDVEIKKFYNWYKAQHKIPSRKPSANTIAYFPFVDDANNHTSNAISLTNTGTKDTIWYTFTTTSTLNTQSYDSQVKYLWWWYKVNSATTTWSNGIFYIPYVWWISYNIWQQVSDKRWKVCLNNSNWWLLASKDITLDLWNWHHLAYIIDWTNIKLAIDGIVYDFYNGSTPSFNSSIYLTDIASMNVTLSDFILEDRARTEQEILAYYEWNKDKYIPEASPAFEEQTFNYSYSTWERWYSDSPTEDHTITFDYPYDDIVVDYSFNNYWYESRERLKIYKNWTELFSSWEQTQSSWTYWPISVVAWDELKVQFGWHWYTTRYWLVTSSATVRQST